MHCTRTILSFLVFLQLVMSGDSLCKAQPPAKPTDRVNAEDKTTNLSRYVIGGFGENATAALGVNVLYPANLKGLTISSFSVDSPAEQANLEQYDWILEVDGSPVGFIRGRYYEPWQKYGRSGVSRTELLVSFNTQSGRKFYYPKVQTQAIGPELCRTVSGFDIAKPRTRASAENATENHSRYIYVRDDFDRYSTRELGVTVVYSYDFGAVIQTINSGSAAEAAGLKVGDSIIEVGGAPVGIFNNRKYEVWKQYEYSRDNKVEFLIAFRNQQGQWRYYYPEIELKERQTQN